MEGPRTKAPQIVTHLKPLEKGGYETDKSGTRENGIEALILALSETDIKAESILVHMYQ